MKRMPALLALPAICLASCLCHAQALSPDVAAQVDKVFEKWNRTDSPGCALGVYKDGQIVYKHGYGMANLNDDVTITPETVFHVASMSKQFTAASILLLQQQGKLSLDDKVSKFLPHLTRANEVTLRQLLSHTSGYQDYWPQDYVMPNMLQPTTAQHILDQWARKPLDFDPGTKWQYSNTNYVIAGLIVEKVSGIPLLTFLQQKIFQPLSMTSVLNTDQERLGDTDPIGYLRFALGPPRPAPKEGQGWLFAAGELAMTAEDLAKWDISIIDQKLLQPASYQEFSTDVLLKNGLGTRYGLGVDVRNDAGHRSLSHSGEVSGFTAENIVFPDERVAIVVLTNQDAADAAGTIAHAIAPLLLASDDPATPQKLEQARKIFAGLQHGAIDRSLFTDNANFYFNALALQDFAASLGPLGTPEEFTQVRQSLRGGMIMRAYRIKFPKQELQAWTYELPTGQLEQFQVAPQD